MRIVALCGMGFGTSLILKMAVGDILEAHGFKADIQAWDLGSFKGQAADIVIAPQDMLRHLKDYPGRVVLVNSLIDRREIEDKLMPVVREFLGRQA